MIVCLCSNVSERELLATIAAGATTVKEIGRRCGAGAGCGACKPLIKECLARCREAAAQEAAVSVRTAVAATEPVPA
jgi:bacterioferritin-associated ferredoxin